MFENIHTIIRINMIANRFREFNNNLYFSSIPRVFLIWILNNEIITTINKINKIGIKYIPHVFFLQKVVLKAMEKYFTLNSERVRFECYLWHNWFSYSYLVVHLSNLY